MWKVLLFGMLAASAQGIVRQTLGAGVALDSYETWHRDLSVEGSPYLEEGFKEGIVIIGEKETKSLIRYNAYQETLEILGVDQKPQAVLRKKSIKAQLNGKIFVLIDYIENVVKQKTGYFNPLNAGKVVLYFKPRKKLLKVDLPDHGYEDVKMPKFVDDSAYYLQKNGQPAEEILLNQRYLLLHMKDQKKALKSYINENGLNVKRETDAIKLIAYYNGLAQ